MSTFSKSKNLLLSLGSAIGGISTFYYMNNDKYKVFASWTTNYEPSSCAKWDDNWDFRCSRFMTQKDPNNNEIKKTQAARHIILIRHGQYNLEGENDQERYLTKLGRLQAEYTGKRLQELNFPYTEVVKSTMTRAQETGSIITSFLPNVPVSHSDLLREGAPCPPEPPVGGYRPEKYFFTDGARIEAAFRKFFHRADPQQKEDSFHVIVCHANVIRYLVCKAMQFPAEAWLRISLNHASITWITITPSGRCILRTLGDVGFMPRDAMTTS